MTPRRSPGFRQLGSDGLAPPAADEREALFSAHTPSEQFVFCCAGPWFCLPALCYALPGLFGWTPSWTPPDGHFGDKFAHITGVSTLTGVPPFIAIKGGIWCSLTGIIHWADYHEKGCKQVFDIISSLTQADRKTPDSPRPP